MKKFKLVIGNDISKSKLDVCIIEDPNSKQHNYFITVNNRVGIASIIKEIRKYKFNMSECLFCFEKTGVYSMHLCTELEAKKYQYAMVPAIEIKRSKGLVRGKSDKTDSRDIAMYGFTHPYKIDLTSLPEADLMKLRLLLTEREKLMKALSAFSPTGARMRCRPSCAGFSCRQYCMTKQVIRPCYLLSYKAQEARPRGNASFLRQNENIGIFYSSTSPRISRG